MLKYKYLSIAILLIVTSVAGHTQTTKIPAFPGAEGHGRYTTGGRGGKVIYVTNLNDDNNPGSLRNAISQTGSRIIMFKVSGTIQLTAALKITNGDLTIAGQTAPGDGICLRDYPVEIQADNVIVRFLRFRMGDEAKQEGDSFGGRNHSEIIVDHCSMSWSTDECASFYDNTNFTLQWCLLSESLRNSVHGKGAHGYGGIWGGKNASFHHNLLADHDSRNPRFCGSRYSNKPNIEIVDFRNNVLFNWGGNSIYAAEGGSYNLVNNYFKAGPATSSSSKARIIQPYPDDGTNNQPAGIYGKFYVSGNYVSASSQVTADNWLGVTPHSNFNLYVPLITNKEMKSDIEFSERNVTTHTSEITYSKVLSYAGASLVRDAIDLRIINDVSTGTITFKDGGNGSVNGIIDTQSAVGGWPVLNSILAPVDSDNDGMPDAWEDAHSLKKNDPSDAQLTTVDGKYPNVEVYLYSLVASITENELKDTEFPTFGITIKQNDPVIINLNNTTGMLRISHERNISSLKIYSITGSIRKIINCSGNTEEFDLSELSSGVYIISCGIDNRSVSSQKIVRF